MHYTFLATEAGDDLITEGGDNIIIEASGEMFEADVTFALTAAADLTITQIIEGDQL